MKFNINLAGGEGGDPEVEVDEPEEVIQPDGKPVLGRLRLPSLGGQADGGATLEEVESFMEDSFMDDDDLDPVEAEDESDEEWESGGELEWEAYLSDDEDEVLPSTNSVVADREDLINPLLDDDDEEEVVVRPGGGSRGGLLESSLESERDVFNPLLEDDEDEVEAVLQLKVPARPDASSRDKSAKKLREDREADARSKRKHRGKSGGVDELDGQVGFERKISYEVSVDEGGRETEARKRLKQSGVAGGEEKRGRGSVKPKEVVDGEGKTRWKVKPDSGRLSDKQLSVFRNLNRAGSSEDAEALVKEVFSRAVPDGLDPADERKRKRLANRAIYGMDAVTANARKRFTEKDREVLRFIGMFKYANAKHIARVQQVKEATMLKRLYSLAERGLVLKKELYGAKPLWYLTEGGMVCSGLELPRVKESGITYSMLPHQFVVNHVAGNLWGAGVNVLGLEDFPSRFRLDESGTPVLGESLVSEYEVQSSFASAKAANHRADVYRPAITDAMNREFRKWSAAGKPVDASPEMLPGNEYMWTLFPPFSLKLAYHVPDLVVKRPRTEEGKPQSIAVEVELANKPLAAYERALNAFRFDSQIYGKVVWVVRSRGAARKVQEAARKLDMWDEGRVGIVPIYTEEGVFKNKAVWTL